MIARNRRRILASSSSAFRWRNLSLWLVTIGRIDVSADEVNGIGVVRTEEGS